MEYKIHCKYDELVDPKKLKNNPKNRNGHGQDQIERLAELFKYHGIRHPIIVSNQTGLICAGHGRKLAAIRAGIKEYPVVYQDFETTEAEYAFLQADNAIALWSELDLSGINTDLPDLGPDFDINMLGIRDFKLDPSELNGDEENPYTRKVETPIYEPNGDKPALKDLFDLEKTNALLKEIEASNVDKTIKEFLKYAAYRHIKFNYKNIAEFYAHSEAEEQNLIENSALVVIDFDKAIEHGFVKMTENVKEAYENEH